MNIQQVFRVIVAGSREFNDYRFLALTLDHLLKNKLPNAVIREGEAPGADKLARRYAESRGLDVEPFPADWSNLTHPNAIIRRRRDGTQYDAAAGHRRNLAMAQTEPKPDACVLFWNGHSKGTKDMKEIAEAENLMLRVIYF